MLAKGRINEPPRENRKKTKYISLVRVNGFRRSVRGAARDYQGVDGRRKQIAAWGLSQTRAFKGRRGKWHKENMNKLRALYFEKRGVGVAMGEENDGKFAK